MIPFPPIAARILLGLGALALLVAVVSWYGHTRYRAGVGETDAKWAEASARMQRDTLRALNAADAIAKQREAENATKIEDLRHEAAKGDDRAVGPGVAAVLERLRAQAGR